MARYTYLEMVEEDIDLDVREPRPTIKWLLIVT